MVMERVRAKKHLGQHFLKDTHLAQQIVESLTGFGDYPQVLEVGPGMGVLTQFLLRNSHYETWVLDIDRESIAYLQEHFSALGDRVVYGDFLKWKLEEQFPGPLGLIGNFPYNISSQIFFKVLEHRDRIPEVVGMIQKEVADRLVSPPGNKTYGILSVLLQTFYKLEYLFTVPPQVFSPPPKVNSAVIRLQRNERTEIPCDERAYFRLVKQAFQNRRKTLRNALKPLNLPDSVQDHPLLSQRAEQLSVEDFLGLCTTIENA